MTEKRPSEPASAEPVADDAFIRAIRFRPCHLVGMEQCMSAAKARHEAAQQVRLAQLGIQADHQGVPNYDSTAFNAYDYAPFEEADIIAAREAVAESAETLQRCGGPRCDL